MECKIANFMLYQQLKLLNAPPLLACYHFPKYTEPTQSNAHEPISRATQSKFQICSASLATSPVGLSRTHSTTIPVKRIARSTG